MRRWTLRVQGIARLVGEDGQTAVVLNPAEAAWLALVALGGGLPTETIACWVWPRRDRDGALNNLRQSHKRLRRRVGARLVTLGNAPALADDLAVAVDPHDDGAVLAGVDAGGHPDFADWLDAERARIDALRREAWAAAAARAEAAGEWAAALRWGERLRDADPGSEHAARRLMNLHYLRGDRGAAMREFDRLAARLADDEGLEPDAETLALRDLLLAPRPRPESRPARAPLPAVLRRPPRVVGRDAELARIGAALRAGRPLLLVGEGGVGKSRLIDEAMRLDDRQVGSRDSTCDGRSDVTSDRRAERTPERRPDGAPDADRDGDRGCCADGRCAVAPAPTAVLVRARAHDALVPGRVAGRLAQALAERLAAAPGAGVPSTAGSARPPPDAPRVAPAAVATLAALIPGWQPADAPQAPETDLDRLADALAELAAAARGCGVAVLFVDDLHHADATSLELLRRVVDEPRAGEPGWVLAMRPPAAGAAAPLHEADGVERVELGALTPGEAGELIASLALPGLDAAAVVGPLTRRVGRNPKHLLLALEAWWHGDDVDAGGLPRARHVAGLLRQRLAGLSPAARELARLAAVAVPDFGVDLAAAVLGTSPLALADPWRELEAAGVLAGDGFAHDLVHEAVAAELPAVVAARLHRSVAGWLQQQGGVAPASLARHWQDGGEPARAAAAWRAAVPAAQRLGRLRECSELLQRAAEGYLAAGDADAASLAVADAVDALSFGVGAEAALALAGCWLARLVSAADRARVLVPMAQAEWLAGRVGSAIERAQAALDDLRPGDDAPRMLASQVLANGWCERGDPGRAYRLLQPLRAGAESLPAEQQMLYWGAVATVAPHAGRLDEACDAARAQLRLATRHGLVHEQVTARMSLCGFALRVGDARAALAECDAVDALLPDGDELAMQRAWNGIHRGLATASLGWLGSGLAWLERAATVDAGRLVPAILGVAQNALAQVFVTLGQPAKARAWVADGLASAPPVRRGLRLAARASVERALGGDARPLLDAALDLCDGWRGQNARLLVQAERLRDAPEPAAALAEAAALRDEARAAGFRSLVLMFECRRVDLAGRCGDVAAAARLAREVAAEVGRVCSLHLWPPQVLESCAVALAAAGDAAGAEACRARAWAWLREVALPDVPDAYRHGFVERHPLHARLRRLHAAAA